MNRKVMLGHKIRRLRRELSLTQAQMAERLGLSPSYFNLIENNQRPATAQAQPGIRDRHADFCRYR